MAIAIRTAIGIRTAATRVLVDPIACDGHGVCAELFPERITLDDWGYPIVDPTTFDDHLLPHARRAAEACPVIALRLERIMKGNGER
ncbi:MAG: ferredoxin [Acidimicrobiia bacterium]|nr:ferredoxin [Acidimicrobiia bacterium]